MSALDLQAYEFFKKRFSEEEARFFVDFVSAKTEETIAARKDIVTSEDKAKLLTKDDAYRFFATKEDLANTKAEMLRAIYLTGLLQFLAMIGSIIAIVKFMID